jgi:4-amino-4-deoxy-L-arabinose transferase-like glycosyltransferase
MGRAPRYDGSGKRIEKVMHAGAAPETLLAWRTTNAYFENLYRPGVRSVPEEEQLRAMAADPRNRRGDGQVSSIDYPGFYYAIVTPAYMLFKHSSVLVRLDAVRMMSLLLGILAVVCTFLSARLVMASRALAVAAAVLVMLQPMESQMTAAVNNDAGVIGLAALMFYLQLRFIRAAEPPDWRLGALLGVLAGCIVWTKPHGYAMLPGTAVACAVVLSRNLRARRAWLFASVTGAVTAVLVLAAVWGTLHEGRVLVPPASAAAAAAGVQEPTYIDFVLGLDKTFEDYLFRSAFGQFGWLEYAMTGYWFETTRLIGTIATWGFVAAVATRVLVDPRERLWLRFDGFMFATFTASVAILVVLYAEYRFRLIGVQSVIQGRSFLFALPPAAVAVASCYGSLVPARFRTLSAAALVTGAVCMHIGAIILIARYHYGV